MLNLVNLLLQKGLWKY